MSTSTSTATLTVDEFWATIDAAWASTNSNPHLAMATTAPRTRASAAVAVDRLLPIMRNALETHLATLSLADLRAWETHFKDALQDLYPGFDDEDTGPYSAALGAGSDDCFLDARCFVVAAGRKFYDLFKAAPFKYQLSWVMAEEMLYVAMNVAEKKWGSWDALHEGKVEDWKVVGGEGQEKGEGEEKEEAKAEATSAPKAEEKASNAE